MTSSSPALVGPFIVGHEAGPQTMSESCTLLASTLGKPKHTHAHAESYANCVSWMARDKRPNPPPRLENPELGLVSPACMKQAIERVSRETDSMDNQTYYIKHLYASCVARARPAAAPIATSAPTATPS
jgi:hypothetical protein